MQSGLRVRKRDIIKVGVSARLICKCFKNGWVALKLQVLMRGTFIREIANIPKTIVTQDTVSSSEDIVSKGLFQKDTDIEQMNALKKLLEMVIAF